MALLDHLALSACSLDEGVAHVEAQLGLPMAAGGRHAHMATHNRLIGVGDLYLEVIAIDPAAPSPAWPRWFDLDNFSGPPRLTNWVIGSENLMGDLALAPPGCGVPVDLARGAYRWRMAVPGDGKLPFGGAFPALIQWQGQAHPVAALPDQGLRLSRLIIAHPEAAALQTAIAPLCKDGRIVIEPGKIKELRAEFDTPHGPRSL